MLFIPRVIIARFWDNLLLSQSNSCWALCLSFAYNMWCMWHVHVTSAGYMWYVHVTCVCGFVWHWHVVTCILNYWCFLSTCSMPQWIKISRTIWKARDWKKYRSSKLLYQSCSESYVSAPNCCCCCCCCCFNFLSPLPSVTSVHWSGVPADCHVYLCCLHITVSS